MQVGASNGGKDSVTSKFQRHLRPIFGHFTAIAQNPLCCPRCGTEPTLHFSTPYTVGIMKRNRWNTPEKRSTGALSNSTFCGDGYVLSVLPDTEATGHRWLLSTCSVATATEELNFNPRLNTHMRLVAAILDSSRPRACIENYNIPKEMMKWHQKQKCWHRCIIQVFGYPLRISRRLFQAKVGI